MGECGSIVQARKKIASQCRPGDGPGTNSDWREEEGAQREGRAPSGDFY